MSKYMKKYARILIPVVLAAALILILPTAVREGQYRRQMSLGERYMLALDYESAALAYGRAAEIAPKRAAAWTALADAYTALGDSESALDALQRGLAATSDAGIRAMYESLGGDTSGIDAPDTDAPDFRDAQDLQPLLEAALCDYFGRTDGQLSHEDLEQVTELIICGDNIYVNALHVNAFNEGAPVKSDTRQLVDLLLMCPNLTFFDLSLCELSSLEPFAELTQLQHLYLRRNGITDITPLTGMTWIAYLDFGENQLTDISGLENLTELYFLGLSSNQITDISPLAGLTKLELVLLDGNPIKDYSPVAHVNRVEK